MKSAEATVKATEANLRIAQNQLSYTELVAPDDGVVTATGADPGQVVTAGQMVVEISRNTEHEAVFAVSADHVAHAKLGMGVQVWLQGRPEVAATGIIREISPEADSSTGTYEVRVSLPSPPPEMRLGAVVVGRVELEGQQVISLPSTALLQSGDQPQVWVIGNDGKVHRRSVELLEFEHGYRGRKPRHIGWREGRDRRCQFAGRWPAGEARDGGRMMASFNLSEWAVNNRAIVVFLMLVCVIGGISAYESLGRQEDPDFSMQTMVVQASWPGATAADTLNAGDRPPREEARGDPESRLHQELYETWPGDDLRLSQGIRPQTTRSKTSGTKSARRSSDIKATLPKASSGPFFNDEFGDVFGIIYGITYDGFTPREARDFAETARAEFLRAPDVGKVEIYGDQDEKVYLNFSPQKLANLKLNLDEVLTAIAQQNAVVPSGIINTSQENMLVDVTGALLKPKDIADLNLWIDERFYKLTDIAQVQRGYSDPPTKMFRVNGKPAIGIGVNMRDGGNNLTFGEGLHEAAERLMQRFPVGIELNLVSDQPEVVREAIGEFTKALFEAILIVLGVSFLSLGVRAGLVVALSIPLVLAIVFMAMEAMGISLQRISLGALIIALGLLVDDAMITIEMMISKIEEGMEKVKAATFAYTSTAFPMLTGTLITIFGFLPIGFADNNTGQYTFSLFAVVAVALVASWFVAVIFAPVIGLVRAALTHEGARRRRAWPLHARFRPAARLQHAAPLAHHRRLARGLRRLRLRHGFRAAAVLPGLKPAGAPGDDDPAEERLDRGDPGGDGAAGEGACSDPDIARFSSYVGGGAIRFYLPLDVQLDNDFMAETVVVAKDLEARDRVQARLETAVRRRLPGCDGPHLPPRTRSARRLAGAIPGKCADNGRGEALCRAGRECPAGVRPRAQRQLRLG